MIIIQGEFLAERGTMVKEIWQPNVSVRPSVQTRGRGVEGSLKAALQEDFPWQEIAWCFWATRILLAGNSMIIVAFEKEVCLKALAYLAE